MNYGGNISHRTHAIEHTKPGYGKYVLLGFAVIAVFCAAVIWYISETILHEYLAAMLSIIAAIFLTGAIGVDAIERIK